MFTKYFQNCICIFKLVTMHLSKIIIFQIKYIYIVIETLITSINKLLKFVILTTTCIICNTTVFDIAMMTNCISKINTFMHY